jgi:hypothetical protein
MARFYSYLERGAEIVPIGSCVAASIDEERRAAGPILNIGGKAE